MDETADAPKGATGPLPLHPPSARRRSVGDPFELARRFWKGTNSTLSCVAGQSAPMIRSKRQRQKRSFSKSADTPRTVLLSAATNHNVKNLAPG